MGLQIDGTNIEFQPGDTLFEAARKAGTYIPALCTYPGMHAGKGLESLAQVYRGADRIGRGTASEGGSRYEGCGLCVVDVDRVGYVLACEMEAEEGMVVRTNTSYLSDLRRKRLEPFLSDHPHACIFCPYNDGCDLVQCTFGKPIEERCCSLFGNCELQRMAQYVGANDSLGSYHSAGRPKILREPLVNFDYEMCVGCLRCVRACSSHGNKSLGFSLANEKALIGTVAADLKSAQCIFCGACIEVCPTSALTDKSERAKAIRRKKLNLAERMIPAGREIFRFEPEVIATVPDKEGVFQLLDEDREVILIKGTENLREALEEEILNNGDGACFVYELDRFYTSRENQLLQLFLERYGRMPRASMNLDDLF